MSVRIAGIIIPMHQHVVIGLTAIFGIGRSRSLKVCRQAKVDPSKKVQYLTTDELDILRNVISPLELEGDLRRKIALNIKRLSEIQSYRGLRHQRSLPLRGQRTRTNARTRKGKRKKK